MHAICLRVLLQVVVLTGRVLQLQERIRKLTEEKAQAEREAKALREAQIMPSPPDKARVDATTDAGKAPQGQQGQGTVAGAEPGAAREGRQGGGARHESAQQVGSLGTALAAGSAAPEAVEGQQGEGRPAVHERWDARQEREAHAETPGAGKRKRGSDEECDARGKSALETSTLLAQVEKARGVLTSGVGMAESLLQQLNESSAAAPVAGGSLVEQLKVARSHLDQLAALISKAAPSDDGPN